MINRRVSMSKKIARLTDKAKVLWFMIYPHLDREGRIAFDDIQDLKIEIIPYFNWTIKKIADALNEIADIGLIVLYPNNNKIAMQFNRFEDFQVGLRKEREAESDINPPEENPESSGNFRILPPKFKLNEVKGRKEGRKEEKIFYDFESSTWKNTKEKDIEFWKKAYPACNIKLELLAMADWLESNPEKKKSNYRAFISRWLKKQQDQGGSNKNKQSFQTRQEKEDEKIKDWARKEE